VYCDISFMSELEEYEGTLQDLKRHVARTGVKGVWTKYPALSRDLIHGIEKEEEHHIFETNRNMSAQLTYFPSSKKLRIQGDPIFREKFNRCDLNYKDPMSDMNVTNLPDRISENLYLGGQDAALNLQGLKERNITHILAIGRGLKMPYKEHIKYKYIDILDWEEEEILAHFDSSNEFIDEGRAEGGVLIHCVAGVSRSSTITIAYLMHSCEYEYAEARQYVHSKRWIHPNDGFVRQLIKYEKALELKRKTLKKMKKQQESIYREMELKLANECQPLHIAQNTPILKN